jgi:Ca2+-transporting ATPase
MEMHPTPGAQAHFAYSTTLRRHSLPHDEAFPGRESVRYAVTDQDSAGLWDRLLGMVKGKSGGSPEENGYIPVAKTEQTPSATYATYHADVRYYFASVAHLLFLRNFPRTSSNNSGHLRPMA